MAGLNRILNNNELKMKCFVCDLDMMGVKPNVCLGIPAEFTERIIPVTRMQTGPYEIENGEEFISLPVLFRLKDTAAPHGMVLKSKKPLKTVLNVPQIKNELEIPDNQIHPLPEVFSGMFLYFQGAYFTGQYMVLILNPEFAFTIWQNQGSP